MKICSKCKEIKPFDCFSPRKETGGYFSRCKMCRRSVWNENSVEFNQARRNHYSNKEKLRNRSSVYAKNYRIKHKERLNKELREKWRKIRYDVLQKYGAKCVCCEETNLEFLVIDHVLVNGAKERKELGGTTGVYKKILKTEISPEYRVLCHNCNSAMYFYGYCPHQKINQI